MAVEPANIHRQKRCSTQSEEYRGTARDDRDAGTGKLHGQYIGEAKAGDDLPELVEALLLRSALSALSMARKAGLVVTGFGQVTETVGKGGAVAVLHAREAADDGRRKIGQAIRRRFRAAGTGGDGSETPGNAALWQQPPPSGPKVIAGIFASSEMDLALGGANVIHAALLAGGASTSFLKCAAALARYRGEAPDTDWTADLS